MLLRTIASFCIAAALLAPAAAGVSAQSITTVRVVSENAVVMSRPSAKAVVAGAPEIDTVLEAIDSEGDWYWVLLNRDAHGTRRAGWIRRDAVEVLTQAQNGLLSMMTAPPAETSTTSTTGSPAPKEKEPVAAKREKPKKDDDRALRKAEQELEKARRDFEKLSQPAADAKPQP
jgi:hypothetical protein